MICNRCGNKLEGGAKICEKCGNTIPSYSGMETLLTVISATLFLFGLVLGIEGEEWFWFWAAVWTIVFSGLCKRVGNSKGIYDGFMIGWFFGIIGLIVMAVSPSEVPTAANNVNNANKYDKYESFEKLQKLKDNGTITEMEFEEEKAKILNS